MKPIRVQIWVIFGGVLLPLFTGGCVVQRTVKEGDVVVEKHYVIKDPL